MLSKVRNIMQKILQSFNKSFLFLYMGILGFFLQNTATQYNSTHMQLVKNLHAQGRDVITHLTIENQKKMNESLSAIKIAFNISNQDWQKCIKDIIEQTQRFNMEIACTFQNSPKKLPSNTSSLEYIAKEIALHNQIAPELVLVKSDNVTCSNVGIFTSTEQNMPHFNIKYNDMFVKKLTSSALQGIFYHEFSHAIDNHGEKKRIILNYINQFTHMSSHYIKQQPAWINFNHTCENFADIFAILRMSPEKKINTVEKLYIAHGESLRKFGPESLLEDNNHPALTQRFANILYIKNLLLAERDYLGNQKKTHVAKQA